MKRLERIEIKPTSLVGILGRRGFGKTTLSMFLQNALPRLVVLDTMNEYRAESGDTVVGTIAELKSVLAVVIRDEILAFRILYKFKNPLMKREQAIAVIQCVNQLKKGKIPGAVIVFEEIHKYLPQTLALDDTLADLITEGRHSDIGIIGTTQSPSIVSKLFVTNCEFLFVSRQWEKNVVNYLKSTTGVDDNTLRNLEKFAFLCVQDGQYKGTFRAPKPSKR